MSSCPSAFEFDRNFNPQPMISRTNKTNLKYLNIVGEAKTTNGILGLLIKKRGIDDKWYSEVEVFRLANQGDPRYFIKALGEELGLFFGFERIDETSMIIPTPEALQNRIDLWNRSVAQEPRDQISIGFYAVTSEIPSHDYVRRFAKEGKLPIFKTGITFLHDISYHTLSVFLEEWARGLRIRVSHIVAFDDFVKTQNIKEDKKIKIQSTLEQIYSDISRITIDGNTANFSEALALSEPGRKWTSDEYGTESPRNRLIRVVHLMINAESPRRLLEKNFSKEIVKSFFDLLEAKNLEKEFESWKTELTPLAEFKDPYPSDEQLFDRVAVPLQKRKERWLYLLREYQINQGG
ncbi:MAG: hypothetical protein SGJ18_10290 [Pseudomonadota bacterium]|nr:hypothetical protein [Pseudomonadota bacterium]